MQFYYKKNEAHVRMITAIGYNPFRHVIVTGSEDGLMKFWEVDTGNLVASIKAHQGWVKGIAFWKGPRLLLSCSLDCTIILWRGEIQMSTVFMGDPVQSMTIIKIDQESEDQQASLIVATSGAVVIEPLVETGGSGGIAGGFINVAEEQNLNEHHRDIVSNVCCCDNKIASVGFDLRLVLYEYFASSHGPAFVNPLYVVKDAHDAAITCLTAYKDLDDNIWFITGAFDKCIKVWSSTGKLVTRVNELNGAIIEMCVVDRAGSIWVSTGDSMPWIIDARSGENMTSFTSSFKKIDLESSRIDKVAYLSEVGMVVATTTRRHLVTWRYQSNTAITRLICGLPVECITYTKKSPILLFCSVGSAQLLLWENNASNEGAYRKDLISLANSMKICVEKKLQSSQFQMDPNFIKLREKQKEEARKNKKGQKFLQLEYIDEYDYLIAACEDSMIYVIGYDISAIEALLQVAQMKPSSTSESKWKKTRFKLNLTKSAEENLPGQKLKSGGSSSLRNRPALDPVTMRVTGLTCLQVLIEHRNVVTGIAVVPPGHGRSDYYLLSCSWDQRVLVWNLAKFELTAKCFDKSHLSIDTAADDVITQIAYAASKDQMIYSSGDYVIHIRKFALCSNGMQLISRVNQHDAEITRLIWLDHAVNNSQWISSSDDHTIRLWTTTASPGLVTEDHSAVHDNKNVFHTTQVINAGGPVANICFEQANNCIIAAVGRDIKIFDIIEERMVQCNTGHIGEIRELINIPDKSQFVSVGEDGQVLLWNHWIRPKKYVAAEL